MAKIFISKNGNSLQYVLEEIKKHFSHLEIDTLNNCQYNPCVAIADESGKPRVRFYGNLKFDAFIESVKIFETGNFHLNQRVLDFIDMIDKDVNIKIFVTQGCGWCYPAIVKAVSFAYVSSYIEVEVFDCYSFPDIATKYNVITVPKTVINDKIEFIGSKEDNEMFGYIMKGIEV